MSKTYPIDSDFVVRESTAQMPSSCWGRYSRFAVIEVDQGVGFVDAIDVRLSEVRSIVALWDKCHVGTSERCAAAVALREAKELAARLNKAQARRRKAAATRAARKAAAAALEAATATDALALAT